jgi:hypothetical protein
MRPIPRLDESGLEVKAMDTILNSHYDAVFSGTPEEVKDYLLTCESIADYRVKYFDGRVVYASEYLAAEPA